VTVFVIAYSYESYLNMNTNEPVVAVVGTDVSVVTVLAIGVVNGVVVAVVAEEAAGDDPVVPADVLTVYSDAVVNVAGAVVLAAKHTNALLYSTNSPVS